MDEKRMPTAEELTDILSRFGLTAAKLRQFKAEEDGYPYSVWHVQTETEDYVLKRAKGLETEVYRSFFPTKKPYAPDRKSTRLNSSHPTTSRMPSSA